MTAEPKRTGIFKGDDPFEIARAWLTEAEKTEPNDPNAIALATTDRDGLPNVRMVLLKEVTKDAFVFYTNYSSAKGREIDATGKAAFVMHWKSLRRQIRVRGEVTRFDGPEADAYFESRSLQSKLGAWASQQSQPLESRASLVAKVAKIGIAKGVSPKRPPFWGGFRIEPVEIEFWADGAYRLHDRYRWVIQGQGDQHSVKSNNWLIQRLNP